MFDLFKKKSKAIHEPLELQIADIKKNDPIIVDKILNGIDCDYLPTGQGPFGSVNNPIPVNGLLGEIKYLGKLRGKSGHPVFFHRIGSLRSTATENLIDKYELVCNDNTQWTHLFFDLYHPRRSNICPEGFSLTLYNEKLKMDIPFAFGVDYYISDFPFGLPKELEKFPGKAFSRRAKEWLEKYKFINPFHTEPNQFKESKIEQSNEKKVTNMNNSLLEIEHYPFMSGVINEILSLEKEVITKEKSKLNNFSCPPLIDNKLHIRFMIERYLYLSALISAQKISINLTEMNNYVNSISMEEYKLSNSESLSFIKKRIDFYSRELEMLSKFKHPHPGKIVWSLYNPSNKDVSDDLNSMSEKDIFAGMYLLGIINETFKNEYNGYIKSKNEGLPLSNNFTEAQSFYLSGINFEKLGDYEEALDYFFKAKSIDKGLEGLSAHILISQYWTGEFEIEDEFENLFELFSNEINKNPGLIELLDSRAWLCYHILNNVTDLNENKISFFKNQSVTDFTSCIRTDPDNFKYYGSRSMLYTSVNDFSKALNDINKAIELVPSYSRHYKDRAYINKCLGQITDSIKDIEAAITLCEDERWKNEYIKFRESLMQETIKSKKGKKIISHIEKITNSTKLKIDDIVSAFDTGADQNKDLIEYVVSGVDKTISLKKMSINGEPLKKEQREIISWSFDSLIEKKFNLLIDETDDRNIWPNTLDAAVKELVKTYDDIELQHISILSWSEFQMEYNTIGGLDQWVRNYFGLWRGNYDLLLDSKIEKINADNASLSILYHFWEYVVDHFKSKK